MQCNIYLRNKYEAHKRNKEDLTATLLWLHYSVGCTKHGKLVFIIGSRQSEQVHRSVRLTAAES